jgi:hypothetical protein
MFGLVFGVMALFLFSLAVGNLGAVHKERRPVRKRPSY